MDSNKQAGPPPVYQQQQQPPLYYQPPGYAYGPGNVYVAQQEMIMEPPPPSYTLLSWFTCLCCCWPLGLIAIVKSCDVNSAIRSGDLVRARESSESAKKFAYLALGIGILFSIVGIIICIIFATQTRHFHFHTSNF